MSDDECRHELPAWMCADCRPGGPPADDIETTAAAVGGVVTAQFEGMCGGRYGKHGCKGRIDPGDEIRMQHGTAVHDGCEDE